MAEEQGTEQGAGEAAESWLPEELATNPALNKFESPGDLAKSYLELEQFRGNSLRLPGEDAGEADIAAFQAKVMEKVPGLMQVPDTANEEAMGQIYRQLGAPEDGQGYQTPEIDAKGLELNTGMVDGFREVAAKYGLNQNQFAGIVREMSEANVNQALEVQKQMDAQSLALKTEWGQAHDQRFKQITNFAESTKAPPDLIMALREGKIQASTAKWLYSIMNQFTGEKQQFDIPAQEQLLAPGEAQAQIDEIYNNKDHPYWHPEKPGHEEAKKKMQELYEQLEPGKKIPVASGQTVGVGGGMVIEP